MKKTKKQSTQTGKEKLSMSYIEKEYAILERLKETNYQIFECDKNKAMDFLEEQFGNLVTYLTFVVESRIVLSTAIAKTEGDNSQENKNSENQSIHDNATNSIRNLNDICEKLGLELFADIDTNDHLAVSAFIGEYLDELYRKGIGSSHESE